MASISDVLNTIQNGVIAMNNFRTQIRGSFNNILSQLNVITASITTINTLLNRTPQGRLTLQTLTPVMTSANNNKTTIYYTPYVGNIVPLYDGTNMVPTIFSEISVATTDTTKNPAAIGASKVNDWFIWSDGGTLRLTHGPDWTSDTARSAGTALVMVNGILLNSVAITNGPAASRGTYVGTTRSNASSQLDWSVGAASAGGTAALMNVWNTYNRVQFCPSVADTTGTWTYTSSNPRASNNSSGNRINFVSGLTEDNIFISFTQRAVTSVLNANLTSGWALDSTVGYTVASLFLSIAGGQTTLTTCGTMPPQLGYHFVSGVESSDNVNTNTWVGNSASSQFMFLSGVFQM